MISDSTFRIASMSPNPSRNNLQIDINNEDVSPTVTIIISNINGVNKIVSTPKNIQKGNNKMNIDISSLEKGTYLLTVVNNRFERTSKVFIKE